MMKTKTLNRLPHHTRTHRHTQITQRNLQHVTRYTRWAIRTHEKKSQKQNNNINTVKEIVTNMTTRDSDSDTKQTDKEREKERERNWVEQCYQFIDFWVDAPYHISIFYAHLFIYIYIQRILLMLISLVRITNTFIYKELHSVFIGCVYSYANLFIVHLPTCSRLPYMQNYRRHICR